MRVLFMTQTSQLGASARYRVYQYLDFLNKNGFECIVSPAVKASILARYNKNNHNLVNKTIYYTSIVFKRLTELKYIKDFDCVFFQRDILVHFPPIIENLIARRHKKIIFDFDDAIYLCPPSDRAGIFFRFIWDKRKIEKIIKLSRHIIVANNFLKNYVLNFTNEVTVIPTSVDLKGYNFRIKRDFADKICIGWIGSQGTFTYFEKILPVFQKLSKKYNIELMVIGTRGKQVNGLKINYKDWNLDTELEEIRNFDIGVMPLTEDEWSGGKSGTKLLQYMAVGVPAVASAVGVNTEIIKDGINGFLADNHKAWIEKISLLVENQQLRIRLANNARNDVEKFYSIQTNAPKLLEVIKKVIASN